MKFRNEIFFCTSYLFNETCSMFVFIAYLSFSRQRLLDTRSEITLRIRFESSGTCAILIGSLQEGHFVLSFHRR